MESIIQRILGFLSLITVEPVEFIYCMMFTISGIVRDNLFIEKGNMFKQINNIEKSIDE
jgi:hypothetical protein